MNYPPGFKTAAQEQYEAGEKALKELATAAIIPMQAPPPAPDPACSFCKKPKAQVKHLIASGDGHRHICDTCVAQATERMEEN